MQAQLKVTYVLILLMVLAFIPLTLAALPSPEYFGFSAAGFFQGRFWTPLTSIFIHVDAFHLATNMLFLYVFGNALENRVGGKKTISVFLAGGIVGLIAGIPFYSPFVIIVGSSIAVSALLGAVIVLNPSDKSSPLFLLLPLGLVAVIYVIFNAFMLLYDQSGGVAWPSHIIGFCVGVFFGVLWRGNKKEQTVGKRSVPFPVAQTESD